MSKVTVIPSSKHAKLSASSSSRWMNCPGSVRLSQGMPDAASYEAAEGTVAHFIGACALRDESPVKYWLNSTLESDGHRVTVDQEMVDGVVYYCDVIALDHQDGDLHFTEVNLTPELSKLHPDLGGAADHIRYRPSDRSLRVFDFKYGAGVVVEVEENTQQLDYALGAMLTLARAQPRPLLAREVTLTIVQPRIEHPEGRTRDWTFPAVDILDFAADLVSAARATEAADAPLVPGKKQCQFCPAARIPGRCPELEKHHHAVVAAEFGATVAYDPVKLADALKSIPIAEAHIKGLREFAYQEAMQGRCPPDFKLVEKRKTRYWINAAGAIEWAKKRAIEPYEEPEMKSPAQLEKGLKAAEKKELAAFIDSKSSGLTLVPASDERPAAKRISADDFAVVEGAAAKTPLLQLF